MNEVSTIKLENVHKHYGNKHVIKGINLEMKTGEIVGILGPNGAGKTTSFYMIVGIAIANEGKITLDEIDITKMQMHERGKLGIGYLPQEPSIFRGLTVEENIMAILEFSKFSKSERMNRLNELLEEFGIEKLKKQNSVSLSGGERRRLEIARLLALNPKFVFLDEPFAGVDPVSVTEINSMIFKLKEKNIGVIITDHNVRETLKITDKTYIIYEGKVLTHGTQEEILQHEETRKYYLGENF
jgi:lipopolysaccharide export system ATP-binding protein